MCAVWQHVHLASVLANAQDEERAIACLLDPFDGLGTPMSDILVYIALRSLEDGPPIEGHRRIQMPE
jgi:hypothetical protein